MLPITKWQLTQLSLAELSPQHTVGPCNANRIDGTLHHAIGMIS